MCFSPQVSFAAALFLFIAGKIAHAKALPRFKRFAAIPTLFAIQQASEGMVWLSLIYWPTTNAATFFAYIFILFAYIIWPTYIPWSLQLAETNKQAHKKLMMLQYFGTFFSFSAVIYLLTYGIQADIAQCHIAYTGMPLPMTLHYIALILYVIPTIGSFFVSTIRHSNLAGCAFAVSCSISYYVWYTWFTSIWCFFAALLSVGILFML